MTINPVDVLSKLVAFDTRNDDPERKSGRECPEYINYLLAATGCRTELLEFDGYYTAFGRRGQGASKILFLAHFDVVPFGEDWNSNPLSLRVDGDIAYGRGACDDKGNIVTLILLAEKLMQSDLPCTVMFGATGDEEIGGRQGAEKLRDWLIKQGLFPDYVVIADGIHQQIIHRRRNIFPTTIKVRENLSRIKGIPETVRFKTETYGSNTRHSAYLRPGVDRHAMLTASKYLDLHPQTVVSDARGAFIKSNVVPDWVELDVIHPDPKGVESSYDIALTNLIRACLSISQAAFPTRHSDKGKNIFPNLLSKDGALWSQYYDIRAMTNDNEEVERSIQEATKGKLEVFSLKVLSGAGYVDVDPDSRLIRAMKWALEKEGIFYSVIEGFGGSDSRYFASQGVELFDFGPKGDNVHGPNEWVFLPSIIQNADAFHTLIEVLTREKSPV
jgi:succinyl-diaminopimelate desuccinylase